MRPQSENPLTLYVHWPFCRAKCPYCDFNSHVAQDIDHQRFAAAYRREMTHMAAHYGAGRKLVSVFLGGGTPSLMPVSLVAGILDDAERIFGFADAVEITAEANPTSSETAMFEGFRAAGVNRVSLGIQSLRDDGLAFLGREHSADDARTAIATAQRSFRRVSGDLIYARRDQTLDGWTAELQEMLALGLTHMSLYQLTIEQGTIFHTRSRRGEQLVPPDDLAAEMYEATDEMMTGAGLPAYEISNHAVDGEACRHNLVYWRAQDWIGVGPGAHGRLTVPHGRLGIATRRSPAAWLDAVHLDGHGIDVITEDDIGEAFAEWLMMGLRLGEGVSLAEMQRLFPAPTLRLDEVTLAEYVDAGLLETAAGRLRATRSGRLLLNSLLANLLIAD